MPSNVIPIAREKAQQLPRHSTLPTVLSIGMAVVSSVSLLLLVQASGVTTTAYDVKRLEQERNDWQQANFQIEAEIARLQSLNRIDKEARSRLRMVPPTDYVFVTVREVPDSVTAELSPPSHAKGNDLRSGDGGWSEQILDWLGSTLGFRQQ